MPANLLRLRPVRIGLYKPWVENIDEGWTRWLLERYEFPFASLTDDVIRRGGLRASFDAIVLPSAQPERLISGHRTAYSYLPRSVANFPVTEELARRMRAAGFSEVRWRSLTLGIAAIHVAVR